MGFIAPIPPPRTQQTDAPNIKNKSPYNSNNIPGVKPEKTFLVEVAAGIVKPVVQTGISVIDPFVDLYNKATKGTAPYAGGVKLKSKFLGGDDGFVYSFLDQAHNKSAELGKRVNRGEISFAKGLLGSVANAAEPVVDVGSLLYGGGELAALAKAGGKAALKDVVVTSLKQSLKRGGAIAGAYDVVDQLEKADDYNVTRTLGAVALGTVLDLGISKGANALSFGLSKTGELVSKAIPTPVKRVAADIADAAMKSKPAQLVSMAFGNKKGLLKRQFGQVGEDVGNAFSKVMAKFDDGIGEFQRGLIDLSIIRPPQGTQGKFRPFLEKWKDQNFKFDVRDALGRVGKFADQTTYNTALEKDPDLKNIVEFFDKYRKDKGLLGQQMNLVENLEDIDTYFTRYTPHVELSGGSWNRLASATTDAEKIAIYEANSPAVKEMIEYGVSREGKWKSVLEGYKNYYDAMDVSFGGKRVADNENAYLQWSVQNGNAQSIQEAKDLFMRDIDRGRNSLTPRISSYDFERKAPMPWHDPDPVRVMTKYIEDTNKRIAYAEQFGNNDEVLNEMVQKVRMDEGAGQAEDFVNIIRRITGQVTKRNGLERAAAFFNNIETLKLVSSALLNIPQAVLYAIPTDFSAFGAGIRAVFGKENLVNSIERGVYISDLARQTRSIQNLDQRLADTVMRYSGFGYLDMLVKSMGSGVADSWSTRVFTSLEKKLGREISPEERATMKASFAKDKEFQSKSLREAYKIQKDNAKLFNEEFKGENFTAVAGEQGHARAYSDALDSLYKKEVAQMENAKKTLERSLSREGREFTSQEEEVKALMSDMKEIKASIDIYQGGNTPSSPGPEGEFSQRQVDEALAEAKKLLMESLNKRVEELSAKFDDVRAIGLTEGPNYSQYLADGKQRAAQINEKIKRINAEIEAAGKAQLRKKELLGKISDSYEIAKTRMASENPDIVKFRLDKQARKSSFAELNPSQHKEYHYLKELGIDPDEALARGHLTREDIATATQSLVEQTQGSGSTLMTPLFAESPGGKIFYQFKKIVLQQMNFFGKQIKRNLVSKDTRSFGNAAKFLTVAFAVYPPVTGVVRDVRNMMTGKISPDEAFEFDKYWSDWNVLSATGLFLDFSKSFDSGREMEFFTPVAVSDAQKYLSGIFDLSKGTITGDEDKILNSLSSIGKQLVKQTGVGPIIQNYLKK